MKEIDISNVDDFVETMHELDQQTGCPCIGCGKCQIKMQRHQCDAYLKWVGRYAEEKK